MIKISALNEAPRPRAENEEEDAQSITKEAQEQLALTEYNRALELMKLSKAQDALAIFKDLLDTELLDQVERSEIPDGKLRPMLSLKYSCYKNIGAIEASLEHYEDAITSYWEAAKLDDGDVVLWYRIGHLATTVSNLELACSAFRQGLKRNPNHWPCLDNIISVLYAVPDYMNCLLFISMALERDPSYVKGLALREKIFKDIPYFEESYKMFNADWALDPPLGTEYDKDLGEKLLTEAESIAEKWIAVCKPEFTPKPLGTLSLKRPLKNAAWVELGESLVGMHAWMLENSHSFVSRINLNMEKMPNFEGTESNTEDFPEIDMEREMEEENCAGNRENLESAEMSGERDCAETDRMENDEEEVARMADSEIEMEIEEEAVNGVARSGEERNTEKKWDEVGEKMGPEEVADYPENVIEEGEENPAGKWTMDNKNGTSEASIEKCNEETAEKSNQANSEKGSEKLNDKSNERTEVKEEGQKVKKRRRSSLCFLQQWAWSSSSCMRRSARVRGSNRREAEREDAQLEETLRRMFPASLLPETVKLSKDDPFKNMDDSMDTMDLYQLFANRDNNSNEASKSNESSKPSSPETNEGSNYFGGESEKRDVEDFVNEHSGKSNLMIILAKYTEFLSSKWNHEWPKELLAIYLESYGLTRQHIPRRSPFEPPEPDDILKFDADMALLYGELHTDRWIRERGDISSSVPNASLDRLATGIASEELGHIIFASVRDDLFNEQNFIYLLRVLWLKANIFHCQNETEIVIETLELLLQHMEALTKHRGSIPTVKLPNSTQNSLITASVVRKMLMSIRRGQKLAEIEGLWEERKYEELAAILKDTFKFAKKRGKALTKIDIKTPRTRQLSMLLESLWKLEHYEECYVWSEACLNESWQCYLSSRDEGEQRKWSKSVLMSLEKLEACVAEASTFVVRHLPESRLARLVQNLVQMVCHQLDVTEVAVEMPLETVLPWIILHYVLQHEEDKVRVKSPSRKTKEHNYEEDEDEDEDIPTSIMILFTAHDFLGRHSWCCINEAKLLLFTMKLIIPRLRTPLFLPIRDKLGKYMEQIFYCLYGHPNKDKRAKPKYLEDHRVPQIELTWEGAQLLFDFYRPDLLPEYDSPRAASINADTHSLFKKFITLVPEEHDPSSKIHQVTAYIVGDATAMPTVKKPLPYQISSIYSLLGDFLFKYNHYANSADYFLMDLCLHPDAFNSWATLAMVMGTEFGTALTSCKPLPDTKKLLFDAKVAQFCYQRAVELVPAQSVIWIEYGTFAYCVHSFCSRLLKQETDTLSMEKFAALEGRKEETLDIAVNCFISANRVFLTNIEDNTHAHDERWLYHYMLAKIAEKKNEDPPVYLDHYAKASDWLHKNGAHYPTRIPHKNPNYLAVEALEVHYRIHACILKYIEQHDGKALKKSLGQVFMHHLLECANSPFMQFPSKLNTRKKMDTNGYPEVETFENNNLAAAAERKNPRTNQRFNSVEEIPAPEKMESRVSLGKTDSRKRQSDTQSSPGDDSVKRMKLETGSHLQLMQDVVGLVDDLITNVCEKMSLRDSSSDEITILSGDENEKVVEKTTTELKQKMEMEFVPKNRPRDEIVSEEKFSGTTSPNRQTTNVQDLMDELMKQTMELSNESQCLTVEDDDTRKSEGKWLIGEDVLQSNEVPNVSGAKEREKETKEKSLEKKKSQVNTIKDDVGLSRRASQESTTTTQTTTTTETNNSSSSSSDESSSSEDSSESDSSTDTDTESIESDAEKKKTVAQTAQKEEYLTDAQVGKLISHCLAGLEQCVLRFPEHYKSMYRLCHYYFNNKAAKDNAKCRDLLLGSYECRYYEKRTFQGLFADRRLNNFFNGVWRNPIEEIDRPGSFASHMSRCVTLLMQVLKETDDSLMLLELCVQLRRLPDADKKYLRDSEREQLSRQALTLCTQSLRTRIQNMSPPSQTIDNAPTFRPDSRKQLLLDVYKIYREIQKIYAPKDSMIQAFATLLVDTYKAYTGLKNIEGNVMEVILKFCKNVESNSVPSSVVHPTPVTTVSPMTTPQPQILPTSPQTQQVRKPYKTTSSTGRPRGRPPNANKYMHGMQSATAAAMNQLNAKGTFGNYFGANNPLMNPYFMNPLVDPSMLTALYAAGIDPLAAVTYFNQMGNYQDVLRQYQQNLSSITNLTAGNLGCGSLTSTGASPTVTTTSSAVTCTPSTTAPNLMNHQPNISSLMAAQQQLFNWNSAGGTNMGNIARTNAPIHNPSISSKSATTIATTGSTTTAASTKDIPSVSITPVTSNMPISKGKISKHSIGHPEQISTYAAMPMGQTTVKAVPHGSNPQVSLLKTSVTAQSKISPVSSSTSLVTAAASAGTTGQSAKIPTGQIRVSKNLTEPQPAHNSSLMGLNSANPLGNPMGNPLGNPLGNPAGSIGQVAHAALQGSSSLSIKPAPMGMPSNRGPSLQHKLQSKKMAQQATVGAVSSSTSSSLKAQSNVLKKSKQSKNGIGTFQSIFGSISSGSNNPMSHVGFMGGELSGLSVSPVGPSMNPNPQQQLQSQPQQPPTSVGSLGKLASYRKTSGKSKSSGLDITGPIQISNSSNQNAETLSMLTQLQQQSHLEIIPQQKNFPGKSGPADFPKNPPLSLSIVTPQKLNESIRNQATEALTVFELPRPKNSANSTAPKKDNAAKQLKDNYEIITLDD